MPDAAPSLPPLEKRLERLAGQFDPPKVRMAMILFPADPKTEIRVRDGPNCVFVDFETNAITLKTIRLTLREARTMADGLNRSAMRVQRRPEGHP